MPSPAADAHHLQTVCRTLVHSQGWREGCMPHVLARLVALDHLAAQVHLDPSVRLDAVGRRQELLDLLTWVYSRADEPNPLQVHLGALYATLVPPRTPTQEDRQAQQDAQATPLSASRSRLGGGSVA